MYDKPSALMSYVRLRRYFRVGAYYVYMGIQVNKLKQLKEIYWYKGHQFA